ncbi:hypothetical protein ABZU32_01150 [Sphaerisporangium sp. NPDC005288]|uniref:hypothetical protein n=1 Tax=Sphaerisporangium sp. NPDC005288 TaxID=3155114 RepID=UPI0033B4BF25
MNRRPLLVVGGWLVTAAVATGAGVVVTTFLGDAVTGSATRALSPADVRRSLDAAAPLSGGPPPSDGPAAAPSSSAAQAASSPEAASSPRSGAASAAPTATPLATPSASPSGPVASPSTPAGTSKVIAARGGVVVARCEDGLVRLLSWTPAQGYEVKDAERGPRDKVRVRFEGESRTEIEVHCSGGRPVSRVKID